MRHRFSRHRTPSLLLLVLGVLALSSVDAFADHSMPDLTGRSEAEAVRTLEGMGLSVRVVTIADAPPGRVASQSPAAGTIVGEGDTAELLVGVGFSVMTQAPSVIGRAEEDVLRDLDAAYYIEVEYVTRAGLLPGVALRDGQVVGQEPAAGQPLKYRGRLAIRVLRRHRVVPLVVGMRLAEAQRVLDEAGLDSRVVIVPVTFTERGTVVSQEPEAEARIPRDGIVELRVAERDRAGPAERHVRVPDLVGLELDDAEDALIARGFLPHVHFEDRGTGRPLTVLAQEVPQGRRLAEGSHVGLTVSRPSHFGERVRAPVLYGLERAEALDLLQHMGLQVQVREQPAAFRPGTVMDQGMPPGSVVPVGGTMSLVVASAPPFGWSRPRVQVPSVLGLRPTEAYAAMRRAGLEVRFDMALGADHALGRVFRQSRNAGTTVVQGTQVELALPFEATVPELAGLTHHQALEALQAAGLQGVGQGHGADLAGHISRVYRQEIPAGRVVARGSVVHFHYRLIAPPTPMLRVPNVVGLSHEDAAARLSAAGFTPVLRAGSIGAGRTQVVEQNPLAGSMRPQGHEVVALYRYVGPLLPSLVQVPRVIGQEHDLSLRQLQALGFVVRSVRQGPQLPFGRTEVIAQNPTGGTMRPRGAIVTLTYRHVSGPGPVPGPGGQLVQVPNVVGQSAASAAARLRTAGFTVAVQGLGSRVQGQSPLAGSFVPRGTTVTLRLR